MKIGKRKIKLEIGESVSEVGLGPLTLDCTMARRHGWSDKQINRVYEALAKISRLEGGRATRRHPERYAYAPCGELVFAPPAALERELFGARHFRGHRAGKEGAFRRWCLRNGGRKL